VAEFTELKVQEEDPRRPGYRADCPEDMVLLVVYENRCSVLEYIGSGMDWIDDNGMLSDYFDPEVDGMAAGVYVWTGTLRETQDPISREYDSELNGKFRPATAEEWYKHLDGDLIWDSSLWFMPDEEAPSEKSPS
jgi:hypothetical protein